jgi:hypothetical protein
VDNIIVDSTFKLAVILNITVSSIFEPAVMLNITQPVHFAGLLWLKVLFAGLL